MENKNTSCILELEQNKQEKDREIIEQKRTLTYANDIVILTNGGTSQFLLETLSSTLIEYGMNINIRKSQYMANKQVKYMDVAGYDGLDKYERLCNRALQQDHRLHNKVMLTTTYTRQTSTIETCNQAMVGFIKPYFDYISPNLQMQSQSLIEQYTVLWKKSLKIICGVHRNLNVKKMEDLFGYLPFYGRPEGYLNRQWNTMLNKTCGKNLNNNI